MFTPKTTGGLGQDSGDFCRRNQRYLDVLHDLQVSNKARVTPSSPQVTPKFPRRYVDFSTGLSQRSLLCANDASSANAQRSAVLEVPPLADSVVGLSCGGGQHGHSSRSGRAYRHSCQRCRSLHRLLCCMMTVTGPSMAAPHPDL